jgi:hypothetical protein
MLQKASGREGAVDDGTEMVAKKHWQFWSDLSSMMSSLSSKVVFADSSS